MNKPHTEQSLEASIDEYGKAMFSCGAYPTRVVEMEVFSKRAQEKKRDVLEQLKRNAITN